MRLPFGRNKKGSVPEDGGSDQAKKPVKKNKKDMMKEVLNESVTETVMDDFRDNPAFAFKMDDKPHYVGLWLDADDPAIGGINLRHKNDESKGSLIESINGGHIRAYLPEDLLLDNKLIIIPTAKTLDLLSEYQLMTGAPFKCALIDDNGKIEVHEDWSLDYDTACKIGDANAEYDLDTYFREVKAPWALEEDEDETSGEETEPEESPKDDQAAELKEQGAAYQEENQSIIDQMNKGIDDMDDDMFGADPEDYDNPEEEAEDEPVEDIPREEVEAASKIILSPHDLDFNLTAENFDLIYADRNEYLPIKQQDDGWLSDQINSMVIEANAQLDGLRQQHLQNLRSRFVATMTKVSESLTEEFRSEREPDDPDDDLPMYVSWKEKIEADRTKDLDELDDTIELKKKEIKEKWDSKLEEVGQAAAEDAKDRYRTRYGPSHEEELSQVADRIRTGAEQAYLKALDGMHRDRRQKAAAKFEDNRIETINTLKAAYDEMVEEEKAIRADWLKKIEDYRNEHREAEVARIKALQDELDRGAKLKEIREDHKAKLEELDHDYKVKLADLETRAKEARMADQKAASNELAKAKDKYKDLQAKFNDLEAERKDLLAQYQSLDQIKDDQYAKRIEEIKTKSDEVISQYEHTVQLQKHNRLITTGLAVVAVVAALAIGVLFGAGMSSDQDAGQVDQAVMTEFNKRMDQIEKDKPQGLAEKIDKPAQENKDLPPAGDVTPKQETGEQNKG